MKYAVLWHFPIRGRNPKSDRLGNAGILSTMALNANILGVSREYQPELTTGDVCAGSVVIRERYVSQA